MSNDSVVIDVVAKSESISRFLVESDERICQTDEMGSENSEEMYEPYLKLTGYSNKVLRSIKCEIEDLIIKKILALEDIEKSENSREITVQYLKDYAIDKIGNQVISGQTGIAEGWRVPLYKSEFQNLLGLPFTEDHAVAESLRVKKPKQECFNCLSTDHRVTECPVKINNERIAMHRSEFNTHSMQSHDHGLSSSRYTCDPDAKLHRGFIPGKLSDDLKEALGCKHNRLPPFIYVMREHGYPAAWLIEAQVNNSSSLSVHNGIDKVKKEGEDVVLDEEVDAKPAEVTEEIEYDQNKIYTFIGFNEKLPSEFIDESEKYRVKRYSENLSREMFLSTLNLEKKKVIKRRSVYQSESQSEVIEDLEVKEETDELAEQDKNVETPPNSIEDLTEDSALLKKEAMDSVDHGTSFNEIPGTPIAYNDKGNMMVPTSAKFSENICEHRCFEMESGTPTGSYQRIVDLTREFKTALDKPPQYNDDN